MAKALSSLAVGALVKDTGTLYNGKPIVWKIADKGHSGYPSGSVTSAPTAREHNAFAIVFHSP